MYNNFTGECLNFSISMNIVAIDKNKCVSFCVKDIYVLLQSFLIWF